MIFYEDLSMAAFDNDSMTEEGLGIEAVFRSLSTDAEEVRRCAEQRALRVVLAMRGPHEVARMREQAYSKTFSIEDLSEDEQRNMLMFMSVWTDGCATGLKAMRQHT